jgi:hypothetical protein
MIKYFPKNKIITNLYTKGGEFSVNGEDYIGAYYKTYGGKIYSGKNPVNGSSQELLPIQSPPDNFSPTSITQTAGILYNNNTSDYINNPNLTDINTYEVPAQFYPKPTDNDYQKGYIMRYFAKKRNDIGYVIEINKETYLSLINQDKVYDYVTYQAIDIFWQITGPLKDDRKNKLYKVAGIIDTNKRLVESKDKAFRGLIEFIGEKYDKFARPTP